MGLEFSVLKFEAKHINHWLDSNIVFPTNQQLAQVAFENGAKSLRKYARLSRITLISCLFVTQLGFCCAYALFIAKNLLKVRKKTMLIMPTIMLDLLNL